MEPALGAMGTGVNAITGDQRQRHNKGLAAFAPQNTPNLTILGTLRPGSFCPNSIRRRNATVHVGPPDPDRGRAHHRPSRQRVGSGILQGPWVGQGQSGDRRAGLVDARWPPLPRPAARRRRDPAWRRLCNAKRHALPARGPRQAGGSQAFTDCALPDASPAHAAARVSAIGATRGWRIVAPCLVPEAPASRPGT
jgi:hypothetical protein